MSLPHAVIIAGGRGERLGGVRKGDLRIGGQRLLDRVTASLGAVATPLMISVGRRDDGLESINGAMALADLNGPVGGPLAGLAAAIHALSMHGIEEGLLVSVAVDTPFLPSDFVAHLRSGLQQAPAAYAAWGGQFYPPNAIWRIEALAALPEQVVQNRAPASLKALHHELGARPVDWAGHAAADPFANLNTLSDLVALGHVARDRGPSPLIHTPDN